MGFQTNVTDLGDWQPRTVTQRVLVDPVPVAALQALLDSGAPAVGPGDELPPLWHWIAIPRWTPSSALSVDGHERRGSFLPPIPQPRRMWGGGEIVLRRSVRVGEVLQQDSDVVSVERKDSRVGPLTIVVVRVRLSSDDGDVVLEERQDLLYREAPEPIGTTAVVPDSAQEPGRPLTRDGAWSWALQTDPTLLMRFSAATSNAHRIHYDWPYTTTVEGYPGLVVHGTLLSIAMAEVVRLERPDAQVGVLRHRNRSPLFCGDEARITGVETSTGVDVSVASSRGVSAELSTELSS
jgi:3-methylfumaryl-CoA hydratase